MGQIGFLIYMYLRSVLIPLRTLLRFFYIFAILRRPPCKILTLSPNETAAWLNFSITRLQSGFQKTENGAPFQNCVTQKERIPLLERDSILQLFSSVVFRMSLGGL